MIKATRRLASPGRPGISDAMKDKVVMAFNDGANCQAIVEQFGISKSSFYKIIKERKEEQGKYDDN